MLESILLFHLELVQIEFCMTTFDTDRDLVVEPTDKRNEYLEANPFFIEKFTGYK